MYIPLSSLSDAPNNPVPALFHRNQDLRAQHGFPGGVEGKESTCNAGDTGSVPGSGRFPGEGNGNLLQYSCLGESHGQRSLVAYSPWGHKESDMTEATYHAYTDNKMKVFEVIGQVIEPRFELESS